MDIEKNELFIIHEFMSLSMMAGLATRNRDFPVYDKKATDENRDDVKKAIRTYLFDLFKKVKDKELNDIEEIYEYWLDFESVMAKTIRNILKKGSLELEFRKK